LGSTPAHSARYKLSDAFVNKSLIGFNGAAFAVFVAGDTAFFAFTVAFFATGAGAFFANPVARLQQALS
jgi:hypothetical protein